MKLQYALLMAAGAASIAAYAIWADVSAVTDWSVEVGGGLLTSMLIFFLIDLTLRRRREQELGRVRAVGLGRLRTHLMRHLLLLLGWYKAALPSAPKRPPSTFVELFSADYYQQVGVLDFSKPGPAYPESSWLRHSGDWLLSFQRNVDRVMDLYAASFDSPTIELLDRVANSNLVNMVVQLANTDLSEFDKQHKVRRTWDIFGDSSTNELLREHSLATLSLIDCFNRQASQPIALEQLASIWREDTAPRFGSGRIEANDPSTAADPG